MGLLAQQAIEIEALDAEGLSPVAIAEVVGWTPAEVESFLLSMYENRPPVQHSTPVAPTSTEFEDVPF